MTSENLRKGLLGSAHSLLLGYWQVVMNTNLKAKPAGVNILAFSCFDVMPLGLMNVSNSSE